MYVQPEFYRFLLTPEEQIRHDMVGVNMLSLPLRAVGKVVGEGIDLIASSNIYAERAIRTMGEKIQDLVPSSIKESRHAFRENMVKEYQEKYGISSEDTNYFLDSWEELVSTFVTMGAGTLLKSSGKGLIKTAQKISVCGIEKFKFAKAGAFASSSVQRIPLKEGYIDIKLNYGKNQKLTVYVEWLWAKSAKSEGTHIQAMSALKSLATDCGAKKLNIEFLVGNPKLYRIMCKKYEKVRGVGLFGGPSSKTFNVPLSAASSPDPIALSFIAMSFGDGKLHLKNKWFKEPSSINKPVTLISTNPSLNSPEPIPKVPTEHTSSEIVSQSTLEIGPKLKTLGDWFTNSEIDHSNFATHVKELESIVDDSQKIEKHISTNQESSKFWSKAFQLSTSMVQGAINCLAGNQLDRERRDQIRNSTRHSQHEIEEMISFSDRLDRGHPSHPLDFFANASQGHFANLHELVKDYEKDVIELEVKRGCLESQLNRTHQNQKDIAQANEDMGRHYLKLIRKKQKIGSFCRILANTVEVAGKIITLSGYKQVGDAVSEVGSLGGQYANQKVGKGVSKLFKKMESKQRTNAETAHIYTQLYSEFHHELAQVKGQQEELRHFNRQHGHTIFDPTAHQRKLETDITTIDREIIDLEEKAKGENDKIAEIWDKSPKDKHGKFKILKKEKEANRSATIEFHIKTREDIAEKIRLKKEEKDLTEKSLENAKSLASLRQVTHNILNKDKPNSNETDDQKKERGATEAAVFALRDTSKVYDDRNQARDGAITDVISAGSDAAMVIGKILGANPEKLKNVATIASNLWGLTRLALKADEVTVPQLKALVSNHGLNILTLSLSGNISAAALVWFVSDVVVPTLRALVLAHGTWLAAGLGHNDKKATSDASRSLEDLYKLVQNLQLSDEKILDKVQKIHGDLILVGDRVLNEIKEGFEAVLKEMHRDTYISRLLSIDERGTAIVAGSKTHIDKIKRTMDQVKQIENAKDFFGFVEESLSYAGNALYTGYTIGNSNGKHLEKLEPTVNISLLYRNPDHFTGLLSNLLEINHPNPLYRDNTPNWYLLDIAIDGFIKYAQNLPLNSKELKQSVLNICHRIRRDVFLLEGLQNLLLDSVQSLVNARNKVWEEVNTRKERMLVLKRERFLEAKAQAFQHSLAQESSLDVEDILGDKKFYLYNEFREKPFLKNLPNLDLRNIFANKYYGSETWEKVDRIGGFVILMGISGLFSVGVIPLVHLSYLGVKRFRTGNLTLDNIDQVDQNRDQKLKDLQDKIDCYKPFSLLALEQVKSKEIVFSSPVETSFRQDAFYFSMQNRKFTLINQSAGKQVSHLLVDIDAGAEINSERTGGSGSSPSTKQYLKIRSPKIDIQFKNESPIRLEDISKIPVPLKISINPLEYNNEVTKLLVNYNDFIKSYFSQGIELDNNNPFKKISKICLLIPSLDKKMLLAFPKKLVVECEKKLNPELNFLDEIEAGTIIPYYDFCLKEGSLRLHFNFVTETSEKEQKFTFVEVAKFDTRTVASFRKNLDSADSVCVKEFLIQALYTSFVNGLGLPGQGTYQTDGGLIAPSEERFAGLYQLWEHKPECINFKSENYSEVVSENLEGALKAGKELSLEAKQMFQPLVVQLDEDYISITLGSRRNKPPLVAQKELTQQYAIFTAMVKLFSAVDNSSLHKLTNAYFNIIPQRFGDELVEPTICLRDDQNMKDVQQDEILSFVSELNQRPSKNWIKLQQQLEEISVIEKFVKL